MDRRLTPFSGRVAHVSLRGVVAAERFVEGEPSTVAADTLDLIAQPEPAPRGILRQLRLGDRVTVLDRREGHAFVQAARDGYCGWVRQALLDVRAGPAPTHVVQVRASHLYRAPDMKVSASVVPVTLGARLHVLSAEGRFARVLLPGAEGAGAFDAMNPAACHVPAAHIRPLARPDSDPVAVAERLSGTPYLWGGNGGAGIDCSGLVQLALSLCDMACPGDSDMQEQALGRTLPPGTAPRRGDLLFWKGHVAWVADPDTILHANAYHMAVTREPLPVALARIEAQGDGPVTRHARLDLPGAPDLP